MQTEFDIPLRTIWNTCRRNDPVCPGNLKKSEVITFVPTGENFAVCIPCASAIIKRSERMGDNGRYELRSDPS